MTTMKIWQQSILCLMILAYIVGEAEAAKGGSKSMMNKNRGNKRGSSTKGGGKSNHAEGDGGLGLGRSQGKSEKPPCVGICHYNRIHGIIPDPVKEAERKNRIPCVGLCFLNKLLLSQGKKGIKYQRG